MLNAEIATIQWLNDTDIFADAAEWPASGSTPKSRPSQYILVDRTGGARSDLVLDTASILVEVYSKDSQLDASEKANEVADKAVTTIAAKFENITGVRVNSLIRLDDTVAQYYRYQVYLDVYTRR